MATVKSKNQKRVKIEFNETVDGKQRRKFFCSIIAANGNNLNPADLQTRKASVVKAMASFVNHIQNGLFVYVDNTKKKVKKKSK